MVAEKSEAEHIELELQICRLMENGSRPSTLLSHNFRKPISVRIIGSFSSMSALVRSYDLYKVNLPTLLNSCRHCDSLIMDQISQTAVRRHLRETPARRY
jgi:hypothetical protein